MMVLELGEALSALVVIELFVGVATTLWCIGAVVRRLLQR